MMVDESKNQSITTLGMSMRRFGQSLMRHYQSPTNYGHSDKSQNQSYRSSVSIPLDWDGVIERRVSGNQPLVNEFDAIDQISSMPDRRLYTAKPNPPPQAVQRQSNPPPQPKKKQSNLDPRLQRIVAFHKERNKERDAGREQRVQQWREAQERGISNPDLEQPSIPGWKSRPRASFDYIETSPLIKNEKDSPQNTLSKKDDDEPSKPDENDAKSLVRSRIDEIGQDEFDLESEDENYEINEPDYIEADADENIDNSSELDDRHIDINTADFSQSTSPQIQRDTFPDSQNTQRRNRRTPRKLSPDDTGQSQNPETGFVRGQQLNPDDRAEPHDVLSNHRPVENVELPFYDEEHMNIERRLQTSDSHDFESETYDLPVYVDDSFEHETQIKGNLPESPDLFDRGDALFEETDDITQHEMNDVSDYQDDDTTSQSSSDDIENSETYAKESSSHPSEKIHRKQDDLSGKQKSETRRSEETKKHSKDFTQRDSKRPQYQDTTLQSNDTFIEDVADDSLITSPQQISDQSSPEFIEENDDTAVSDDSRQRDEFSENEQEHEGFQGYPEDMPQQDTGDMQADYYAESQDDSEQVFATESITDADRTAIHRRMTADTDPDELNQSESAIQAQSRDFIDNPLETGVIPPDTPEAIQNMPDDHRRSGRNYDDESRETTLSNQQMPRVGEDDGRNDYYDYETLQSDQRQPDSADGIPAKLSDTAPQKPSSNSIQRYLGDDGQFHIREIEDTPQQTLPEQSVDVYQAMLEAGIVAPSEATESDTRSTSSRPIQRYLDDDGQFHTREIEDTPQQTLPEQSVDVYQAMLEAGIVAPSEATEASDTRPTSSRPIQRYLDDDGQLHTRVVEDTPEQTLPEQPVDVYQAMLEAGIVAPSEVNRSSHTLATSVPSSDRDDSSEKTPVASDIQRAMLQRLRDKNAEVANNKENGTSHSQSIQRMPDNVSQAMPDSPKQTTYSGLVQRASPVEHDIEKQSSEDEGENLQQLTRDVFREIRKRIRDEVEKHNLKS